MCDTLLEVEMASMRCIGPHAIDFEGATLLWVRACAALARAGERGLMS